MLISIGYDIDGIRETLVEAHPESDGVELAIEWAREAVAAARERDQHDWAAGQRS